MTDLYLTYKEFSEGGEPLSDEEWSDRSDTYVDWSLKECLLHKPGWEWEYECIQMDDEIKNGDEVHVVYVRYTTGCTFGTIYGAWHIVEIMTDRDKAHDLVKSIENNTYKGYKPWIGYFERLESAEVSSLTVNS